MDANELYGLPLERFVPERSALAKALRGEGRREDAAKVAKLPKPSRAAWAVNQLVRTQGRTVSALFDAGDALQQAQADVIASRGDARALREASDAERAAVKRLTDAARGLLSSEGHPLTAATLDRVAETLHAAALDEDAREHVKRACLERELRHVGLGALGAATAPDGPPGDRQAQTRSRSSGRAAKGRRGTEAPSRAPADRAKQAEEAEEAARNEQAERQRAEELKAARRVEAETRRAADRAAKELEAAEQRRDHAAEALSEAEEELADTQTRAHDASRAHERARAELDRLQN